MDSNTPYKLKLPNNSWIMVYPKGKCIGAETYNKLWEMCPEEHGKIKIMGKEIDVPRFQKAFGAHGYWFSGMMHDAVPIEDEFLEDILKFVNSHSLKKGLRTEDHEYKDVLINWYENGQHYIGPHSDDESQLVKGSAIYSFSFGGERDFKIESKDKSYKKKIVMSNGMLLIMGGEMQQHHKHSVPKSKSDESRINITIRLFK